MAEPNNTNPIAVEHTAQQEPPAGTAGKTFSQEEVDAIVARRLARATKGMPTEEELTAFNTWKAAHPVENKNLSDITTERDTAKNQLSAAQAELEQTRHLNYVLMKGISGDEAEFISFKAAKMVDDKTTFETAVDSLLQARQQKSKTTFDWTAPVGGASAPKSGNAAMNELIRGAFK